MVMDARFFPVAPEFFDREIKPTIYPCRPGPKFAISSLFMNNNVTHLTDEERKMPEPIYPGSTQDLPLTSAQPRDENIWDSVQKVLEDPERRNKIMEKAKETLGYLTKNRGPSQGESAPPGVSVLTTPGGSVVANYEDPEGSNLPLGPRLGTPFAVCLRDGTLVAGDVSSNDGLPPPLEAVRGAAKEAFKNRASFNPLNGEDMTQAQTALTQALQDRKATLGGIMTIQNDPRCTPSSP